MTQLTYRRPHGPPDFEARITYLPTHENGRRTPVHSGYRPNHDLGLPGELNDALHEYPECVEVKPGETAKALLRLLAPGRQAGRLYSDFKFTVQEGPRIIGSGEVVRVLNSKLQRLR
jgi:translation elongation factor EF-Tu-like GTPase